MFRVRVDAQETYRSSVRPVMLASVKHLMDNFNMNQDVLTFFNGETEVSRMIGTSFTDKMRADQKTDVGYTNRQFVTADEESGGGLDELDSCHRWITNPPFWHDEETGAMIVPMFVTRKYNMTINRYFKDRVTANQYRDRIQNTLTNPYVSTFNCRVHYPISNEMLECYEDVYGRLVKAGKVDATVSPLQWFISCCKAPYDIITDLASNNPCFVFKRALDSMTLHFGGVNIVEVTKGKYQGQYLTTLAYSFYLACHTRFELHYPLMVYQQPTNPVYIPTYRSDVLDDYPTSQFYEGSLALKHNDNYMDDAAPFMFVFPKEDPGRLPYWDWMDLKLQRLTMLDDVPEQTTVELFVVEGRDDFWDATYQKYITKFCAKVTRRHHNPMHLCLYSDDLRVIEKDVELTESGTLLLKHNPTMKASYRVAFYLDKAAWLYSSDCVDDILNDEEYGRWIIDQVFPYLPLPGDENYPGNKKPGDWPWIDWNEDIINKLPNGDDDVDVSRRKVYMEDLLLIARDATTIHNKDSLTDDGISMTEYLMRK